MPECMWNMEGINQEQWDAYEAKLPFLKGLEKRLKRTIPPAKVSWEPGAVDVFIWAGGVGTSLTLDIWESFSAGDAEKFAGQYERVYNAVLERTEE